MNLILVSTAIGFGTHDDEIPFINPLKISNKCHNLSNVLTNESLHSKKGIPYKLISLTWKSPVKSSVYE